MDDVEIDIQKKIDKQVTEQCTQMVSGLMREILQLRNEVQNSTQGGANRQESNEGMSLEQMKNELQVQPPSVWGRRDTDQNHEQKLVDNWFKNIPVYSGEGDYEVDALFQDLNAMQGKLKLTKESFVDQLMRRLDSGIKREMRGWDVEDVRALPLVEIYYRLQESADSDTSPESAEKKLAALEEHLKEGDG